MIRNILLSLLVSLTTLWGLQAQEGYNISVTVDGLTSSEAYLAYYFGDKQYIKDTVAVKEGKMVFAGDEPLDGGIYLVVFPPDNNYFEMLVDKDQSFSLKTGTGDFVSQMQVEGSEANSIFYGDLQYLGNKREELTAIQTAMKAAGKGTPEAQKFQEQLTALDQEVKDHRNRLIEEHPDHLFSKIVMATRDPVIPKVPAELAGNDSLAQAFRFGYYKGHYFDNFDWSDGRLLRTPVLYNRVNGYMTRLTAKYMPDSINKSLDFILAEAQANHESFQFLLAHYLNFYVEAGWMGADAVYCSLVENYYKDEQLVDWVDSAARAKMIKQCADLQYIKIGNTAVDFRVKDVNDKDVTLSGTPGEFVAIYFWDYNCGHCKKITPRLQKVVEKYNLADYGVKVITININGEIEEWKKKIEEYDLDMEGAIINTQDIDRKSYATAYYNVVSTPRIYLVDKNKKLIAKQITPEQFIDIMGREFGFEVDEEDKKMIPELEEDEEGTEAEETPETEEGSKK